MGVVLFSALYAVAGARWVSPSVFLVCLVFLFGLMTALWVGVEESQGRGRGALARLGRVVFGLVVVAAGVPIVVLMPLFWLDSQLPPEAGVNPLLAPVMTIVLISLALIGLVNAVGGALAAVWAALAHHRRGGRI